MTSAGTTTPGATGPAGPAGLHRLRRSRTDRVGAGVAGGLGSYFRLDPVLFRVLFATAAFFGGAGVLAYLLAWAAIPEEGTAQAPIDNWLRGLRRRRIPFWLVAGLAAVVLWAIAFSWWAPGPVFPALVAVLVLLAVFLRRGAPAVATAATVTLTKADAQSPAEATPTADDQPPAWVGETHRWITQSRDRRRARRVRAFPVRVVTLVALLVTIVVLGIADAAQGILLPVYFYCALGIVLTGLLVGLTLRRTPWSLVTLLVPAVLGAVAFGGSRASLHDGFGEREWTPTAVTDATYRLAFGRGVLDLRQVTPPTAARTIHVTMAAGQAKVIIPKTLNVSVQAHVRFGDLDVDGHHDTDHGANFDSTVAPPATATGAPITVDVRLADGNVRVVHVSTLDG
jgi:phage shock protein PspC (stress-responsive transcriptional regulator)